ncbi:MAG: ketol-acid reductoisomerase [Holosporaceae bacterium]|nr:ketol-acid reductoisomerase [Holosporaceae bacterium]
MKILYEEDAHIDLIKEMSVAIIGYGSQGRAHALNLRDSGIRVFIGLREDSKSREEAEKAGFFVTTPANAARIARFVMILIPDEVQGEFYKKELKDNLKKNATLAFASGFATHFGLIEPRRDLDVIMIVPKTSGAVVRSEYVEGNGTLSFIAVHRDASGQAKDVALSYACAIGSGKAGIIETTFEKECEANLFGEQAVLCGGVIGLMKAGFETLVGAGYSEETAYIECVRNVKLIADLICKQGIADGMKRFVSSAAEFSGYVGAKRLISGSVKSEMKNILKEIQSGAFANRLINDYASGGRELAAFRELYAEHPLEEVRVRLLRRREEQ